MNCKIRRSVLDVDGARQAVVEYIRPVEKEHAGVINALGRTLAEDLASGVDVPSHNTAKATGYAALSSDTRGATSNEPRHLSVLSESAATRSLEPGTVIRVRSGEALPRGADTLIADDKTYRPDNGPQVLVLSESKPGANIISAGAQISASEVVLRAGSRIDAAHMGLIATLGRPGVMVSRKPRVAIITSGAKVVDIVDELQPGEARNGARYALVGSLIECGCELGRLVHVREGRLGLEKAIERCAGCDAFIVTLSPHDKHEAAVRALSNAGAVCFDRVLMEPGAESAFGDVEGKPFFIAQSEAVLEAFEAFVRPGLLTMLGRTNTQRPRVRAKLAATLKPNPSSSHYIKASTHFDEGAGVTKPMTGTVPFGQFSTPNSFIVIPANVELVKRGEEVDVVMLGP